MRVSSWGAAATALVGLGFLTPTADACWWMFRRESKTTVRREAAPAPVEYRETRYEERPLPGPAPVEGCVKTAPQAPVAGPPPAEVECTIETKFDAGSAQLVRCQKRWVEPVYEAREKRTYCPPVLETRYREVQVPAIYQTCYKQEWVAPVFSTVCRKEWVPPTFKTVCREVKEECQYKDVSFQKYVPPTVRCDPVTRCMPDGNGGFVSSQEIGFVVEDKGRIETASERKLIYEGGTRMIFDTVQDKPGFWKEHIETIMVTPGYFKTVEHRELVKEAHMERIPELVEIKPARVETISERVLVKPGHWEEVPEEVTRNPC